MRAIKLEVGRNRQGEEYISLRYPTRRGSILISRKQLEEIVSKSQDFWNSNDKNLSFKVFDIEPKNGNRIHLPLSRMQEGS